MIIQMNMQMKNNIRKFSEIDWSDNNIKSLVVDYKTIKDLDIYKYFIVKGVDDDTIVKIVNHLKKLILEGYTITDLENELLRLQIPDAVHKLIIKLSFDSLSIEYSVISENFNMVSFMMLMNNYKQATANFNYAEVRKTIELMKKYEVTQADKDKLNEDVVKVIAKWGTDEL